MEALTRQLEANPHARRTDRWPQPWGMVLRIRAFARSRA